MTRKISSIISLLSLVNSQEVVRKEAATTKHIFIGVDLNIVFLKNENKTRKGHLNIYQENEAIFKLKIIFHSNCTEKGLSTESAMNGVVLCRQSQFTFINYHATQRIL